MDVERIGDDVDVTSNNDGEFDRGSPEELENTENDNEINGDIDDVEVKTSAEEQASPVV